MNIQTQIKRTAAEELLLDAFAAHGEALPGDSSVKAQRKAAAELIGRGLPTRRVESWHYTDLRRLLSNVAAFTQGQGAAAEAALLDGSTVLSVVGGKASASANVDGLTVASLVNGLADGKLAERLTFAGTDDTVGAINTAFVADGYAVD